MPVPSSQDVPKQKVGSNNSVTCQGFTTVSRPPASHLLKLLTLKQAHVYGFLVKCVTSSCKRVAQAVLDFMTQIEKCTFIGWVVNMPEL